MPQIDIGVEIPPLPEGWSGTPDELFEFFKESAVFTFDGDFPTGQIGGSRPTQDSGIWYGDNGVEKFSNGAYRTITDVPVGALIPWASASASPPENYLLADGASYLKTLYPELSTAIGTTWGAGVAAPLTFNVPDLRGRFPVGIGIGDYKYQGIVGKMKEVVVSNGSTGGTGGANPAYMGFEWPSPVAGIWPGAPITLVKTATSAVLTAAKTSYVRIASPSIAAFWLIRSR